MSTTIFLSCVMQHFFYPPASSRASPLGFAAFCQSVQARRSSHATSPSCDRDPTCGCHESSGGRCCDMPRAHDAMTRDGYRGGCRGEYHGGCRDGCRDEYRGGFRDEFRGGCRDGQHCGDRQSPRTASAWQSALWWSLAGPVLSLFASQDFHAGARWSLWPRQTSCPAGCRHLGHCCDHWWLVHGAHWAENSS